MTKMSIDKELLITILGKYLETEAPAKFKIQHILSSIIKEYEITYPSKNETAKRDRRIKHLSSNLLINHFKTLRTVDPAGHTLNFYTDRKLFEKDKKKIIEARKKRANKKDEHIWKNYIQKSKSGKDWRMALKSLIEDSKILGIPLDIINKLKEIDKDEQHN